MKTLSFDPIRADVAITEKEKSAALHAKEKKASKKKKKGSDDSDQGMLKD